MELTRYNAQFSCLLHRLCQLISNVRSGENMKLKISIILGLFLTSGVLAEITNIESDGNLKSETKVELKEVSEITNKNNPVEFLMRIDHDRQFRHRYYARLLRAIDIFQRKFQSRIEQGIAFSLSTHLSTQSIAATGPL